MRILHTYCLNYNIGDYALGIGVKNLLRHYLSIDYIGNTNIQGRVFDEYYINEVVNKKYDLLVIGGGGIIHGAHWPNGWFWLIDKELIKTIKIPFIVYGVGYNYWIEEGGIPERGINHLLETKKYAKHFSVRNDGSFSRLKEQIGFVPDVVPDPGFHVNLNTEYYRKIKEPYIIVQLANDKSEIRFGDNENKKLFIKNMNSVLSSLSDRYRVVFAPHVFDDIELSREIAEGIENSEIWDFGFHAFDHIEKAIAYYKYADFVISMRGHGQIIPIAFNKPVISIENHPKHRGLMDNLDLLDYNLNINDENFDIKLKDLVKKVGAQKDYLKEKYKVINKSLIYESDKAWVDIIKQINE